MGKGTRHEDLSYDLYGADDVSQGFGTIGLHKGKDGKHEPTYIQSEEDKAKEKNLLLNRILETFFDTWKNGPGDVCNEENAQPKWSKATFKTFLTAMAKDKKPTDEEVA